jgi:hypothetical protein
MTMPAQVDVDQATQEDLSGLSRGDHDLLTTGLELRAEWQARSGLDPRSYALVKLAALIALDAPPASYSGRWPTRWTPGPRRRTSSAC